MNSEPPTAWADALLAADLIALSLATPGQTPLGASVRARAGPVRDIWLERLRRRLGDDTPWRRFSASMPHDRLIGGLDLAATLASGAPRYEPGVLARADGGVAVMAMAERAEPTLVGVIASALDDGVVRVERAGLSTTVATRFALVALDEGAAPEERAPAALSDRLAFRLDLSEVSWREAAASPAPAEPGRAPGDIGLPDDCLTLMAEAALFMGRTSCRAIIALAETARASARHDGRAQAGPEDALTAIRLVLGPVRVAETAEDVGVASEPASDTPGESAADPPTPPAASGDRSEDEAASAQDREIAVDAAEHAVRLALFDGAAPPRRQSNRGHSGKSGGMRKRARHGKPVGVTDRPPFPGARIDAVATLRAAAPWQAVRRRAAADGRLRIAPADFRYKRYRDRAESTAIFVVDASGSTALQRLGEAKRAVELLLAECYVRRDSVALISFRGMAAETALEPTRSLVRAKRALGGLPGGGPTPLADSLKQAVELALRVRNEGRTPFVVMMTDGSGNIALDGAPDRARSRADVDRLAPQFAALGLASCLIDIGRRPRDAARALAAAMGGDYQPLPRADAKTVSDLVAGYLHNP